MPRNARYIVRLTPDERQLLTALATTGKRAAAAITSAWISLIPAITCHLCPQPRPFVLGRGRVAVSGEGHPSLRLGTSSSTRLEQVLADSESACDFGHRQVMIGDYPHRP